MSVRKDEKRGTWLVKLHYTNHDGDDVADVADVAILFWTVS